MGKPRTGNPKSGATVHNITDALKTTKAKAEPVTPPAYRKVAKANKPGQFSWDGATGHLITQALPARPTTWDEFIRSSRLDPEEVVVKGCRTWGQLANEEGPGYTCYWLDFDLRHTPGVELPSIAHLEKFISRRRQRVAAAPTGTRTFFLGLGDLQLGKADSPNGFGLGPAETYERAMRAIDESVQQLARLRRTAVDIGSVCIAFLGDCIEGFVSQGGANAWRTRLTVSEQIELLQTIMYYAIDSFIGVTDHLIIVGVPGNHDQTIRLGGAGVTRYDDSFDTLALKSVGMGIRRNPAYDRVEIHTPALDEVTVTLEFPDGSIVCFAHGHNFGPSPEKWWAGQITGGQAPGRAKILVAGHKHSLLLQMMFTDNWFLQIMAIESESSWWRHLKGQGGDPGAVTALFNHNTLENLYVVGRRLEVAAA